MSMPPSSLFHRRAVGSASAPSSGSQFAASATGRSRSLAVNASTDTNPTDLPCATALAATGSSTLIPVISGAASSMAPCTASFKVADDDGQPSQLPIIRSRTTPASLTPINSTSPPCEPKVGPYLHQRSLDPLVQAEWMQPVNEEQTGDQFVVRQPLEHDVVGDKRSPSMISSSRCRPAP